MGLKKRSSAIVEDQAPKKRRKEAKEVKEVKEVEPYESKKSSKKSKQTKVFVPKEEPLSEEEEEEVEELLEEEDETREGVAPPWPEADMIELFNRIESLIPVDDSLRFQTRTEHLDWDEIAFNNYTPKDCKAAWKQVLGKIRKFRCLKEIVSDARQWLRKPWTDFYRGNKQNQHPDMPKRPLTQYMLYFMEKKDKVAAVNPHLDMVKLSRVITSMYKELPPEKKEKYAMKAAALRREYEENVQKFYEKHPECVETKDREPRASASLPGGLKKPRTPKQIFIDDRLEKLKKEPNFEKNVVLEQLRQQWNDLSERKRLVWINYAIEEETKYLETLKLRMADDPNFEPGSYKTVLKKDEQTLKDRAAGKPDKPPNSAYSLYSRLMLANDAKVKQLMPKARMKEIARLWALMPDREREEYQKKVKYQRDQYKLEYATYLESLPEEERQELLMKTQTKKKGVKVEENNGKNAYVPKPKISTPKSDGAKAIRLYFPGEPQQPPVNPYDLFVESFVTDTKLSASEAPRFWEMLPASDKAKFQRKLKELKEKYIRDYKKFLKSLDEDEVAKYNELQKRNKEREAAAESGKAQESDDGDDSDDDEASSSDEEEGNVAAKTIATENDDSDSDENEENEEKKSASSSDSSSSSSESSSSSSDSDSSSDESDEEGKKTNQNSVAVKKEESDSDSSDDE